MRFLLLFILVSQLGCVADVSFETQRTAPDSERVPIRLESTTDKATDSEDSGAVQASPGYELKHAGGFKYRWTDDTGNTREVLYLPSNGQRVGEFAFEDGYMVPSVKVGEKPVVYVYLAPFPCAPCEAWKVAKDSMPEFDWRTDEAPDWVKSYPSFAVTSKQSRTGWRKIEGFSDAESFRREWESHQ